MSTLVGRQSEYYHYKPNIAKQSDYIHLDSSGNAPSCRGTTMQSVVLEQRAPLQPVYVEKIDGHEQLAYHSNMMIPGEKYKVTWNDEHFILIKNNDAEIDLYKFYPES